MGYFFTVFILNGVIFWYRDLRNGPRWACMATGGGFKDWVG